MTMINPRQIKWIFLLVGLIIGSFGCALQRANQAFEEGRYEDSLETYRSIVQKDPSNVKARIGLQRSAQQAAEVVLKEAQELERRGGSDLAIQSLVAKALTFNFDNQIAQDWMLRLQQKIEKSKIQSVSEVADDIKARVEQESVLLLNPNSLEGIDISFTRRTSLKEILGTLGKASGINVILHTSFQDNSISIDLKGLSFYKALDTLMLQNEMFYKVVDKNTIMVFKATPQNREQFENQIIKTYFLSNAEPNEVRATLITLIPQLKVFTDKRMNAIIVKAKPLELGITDRVIGQLDKALPEVMVYLELMEVTESSLQKVGLLPVLGAGDDSGTFRIGATTVNQNSGLNSASSTLSISSANIRTLFPNLALDFLKSNGDARLVASPNVRTVSGGKGEVNIGDKISTTQSALTSGLLGANQSGTQTSLNTTGLGGLGQVSFSYEDVGVKIGVEPRVHYNGEITLKIEASVTTLKAGSTPGRPDLGRREIKTTARLKDGETAIFGGLLKDEEQKQFQGIWGVSEMPLIGRLIGNTRNQKAKTDVILTIRAVQVRKPVLTDGDFKGFNPEDLGESKAGIAKDNKEQNKEIPKIPENQSSSDAIAKDNKKSTFTELSPSSLATSNQETLTVAPRADLTTGKVITIPIKTKALNSDLIIFMSPPVAQAVKGETLSIDLNISGGSGITSGQLDLLIPPGLKVAGVKQGDFLLNDSGALDYTAEEGSGIFRINFKRSGQGEDSGNLLSLSLTAIQSGSAAVTIQKAGVLIGPNPISARWVNSLLNIQ
ncbi:MAG: hypothetical protein ACKN9J_03370 [Holophagaceae bacterium]